MRILAISHLFPHVADSRHGIFAARQFAGFQKMGAEVVVFYPIVKMPGFMGCLKDKWKDYDAKHKPIADHGLDVIQTPCIRLTRGIGSCRWDGVVLYHTMKRKAMRLHRQKPFDIIFGRGLFPGADTAARLGKLLGIPAVGVAIGGDANIAPHYSKTMFRHFLWVTKQLDGVLANGTGVAQKIKDATGRDCQTAHGVVDLDVFCPVQDKAAQRGPLDIPPGAMVILFVGYLIKAKGLYELLDAFVRVHTQNPDAMLIICGQGGEYDGLQAKIQQLGLAGKVRLAGVVEPSEMHRWMQAADVFVLPSYSEGMPNVVMEAMACGLPTVSTTVGGLPDGVGDSDGAILVEPKQVEPLAEGLISVCADSARREKMTPAARQTAEQKFGLENNVKKTLEYLQAIIDQSKNKDKGYSD